MSVDLPAPFCPRSATISPGAIARLTSSSARIPGNRFVRCDAAIAGAGVAEAAGSGGASAILVMPGPSGRSGPVSAAFRLLVGDVLVDLVDVQPIAMLADEVAHLLLADQIDGRLDP